MKNVLYVRNAKKNWKKSMGPKFEEPKITKTAEQIAEIHDLLDAIGHREILVQFDSERDQWIWTGIGIVCCWLLGHPSGEKQLEENFRKLKERIEEVGYRIRSYKDIKKHENN